MTILRFLDTETTSLRPDRRVWEVGMIRRNQATEAECRFFVDVGGVDLPGADLASLDVGRFWSRHPQAIRMIQGRSPFAWQEVETVWSLARDRDCWDVPDGAVLDPCDAAVVVAAWTHRAHIVGSVPGFDAEVLAALLRDDALTPTWHYHLIDVDTLAVGWLARRLVADAEAAAVTIPAKARAWDLAQPWTSDDLSRALGVEPPSEAERHTALGDARWAMRVYDAVMGAAL